MSRRTLLLIAVLTVAVTGVVVWVMPAPQPCLSFSCGRDWNRDQVSLGVLSFLTWHQLAMLSVGLGACVFFVVLAIRRPRNDVRTIPIRR